MANNIQTANNKHTGTSPGIARAPERRSLEGDDQESPPDDSGGMGAAPTQEGQPGLKKSDDKDWSPGSDQQKRN